MMPLTEEELEQQEAMAGGPVSLEQAPRSAGYAPPPQAPQAPIQAQGPLTEVPMSLPMREAARPTPPAESSGGFGFDIARGLIGASQGAAGVTALDAGRRARDEAPLLRAKRESELESMTAQRKMARDALDSSSPLSRQRQNEYAAKMRARSELPGLGESLRQHFKQEAEWSTGRTASEIERADNASTQLLGEAGRMMDADAKRGLMQQNAGLNERKTAAAELQARNTGNNMYQDNIHQGAVLDETTRHHKALEGTAENKLTLKTEKDQEKLNEKVAALNEQEELLLDAREQKKKVDTGWLSNKVQQGLKYVGLADKDFMNLESTIAGVNNQIIKLQAGGNVTAGEATRMKQQLADLSMDDVEFDTKLERVLHQIALKRDNAAKQYERKGDGSVRDQAPIGHDLVDGQKPKSSRPAGTRATNPTTGEVLIWDGQKWNPEK